MANKVKPVPEGYHTLTPHLIVRNAQKALEFYQRAFGAEVRGLNKSPDGKIMHAEMKVGDSIVMLNDESPEWNSLSPLSLNGSAVTIHLYAENPDAVFDRAVKAGATVTMPLENQFWGDRYGKLVDPFGHHWSVGARLEELTPEEVEKRGQEFFSKHAKKMSSE
jgi:PhnB protein